jgi:hypothetical protein
MYLTVVCAECTKLAALTRASWKIDRHIIASLETKKMRITGLRKLFKSVENLGKRLTY